MCELLVKAIDANHPDPVIDLAGSYKRGDVVVIMPDGHTWGTGELDTNVFAIIKHPGVSVDSMKYMLYEHVESLPKTAALKVPRLMRHIQRDARKTKIRKRFSINIDTQIITDKARV